MPEISTFHEKPKLSIIIFTLVIAARDLQNYMFCQLAEPENDFRHCLDPHLVEKEKEYLIQYIERTKKNIKRE